MLVTEVHVPETASEASLHAIAKLLQSLQLVTELDWLWLEHAFVSAVCLCMRQSSASVRILFIPVMTTNVLSMCSALLYWNQTVLQTYDH